MSDIIFENVCNHQVIIFSPDTPLRKDRVKNRSVILYDGDLSNIERYFIKVFPKYKGISPDVIETTKEKTEIISGIPVQRVAHTAILDLPEPKKNTIYIVSNRVLRAIQTLHPERKDFVFPNKLVSVLKDPTNVQEGFKTIGTLSLSYFGNN